ncbi:hypothetical protein EV356DRAFT_578553 [Viridothelium virens]|uniref:Nephrocystin 3-like N-terminal domain-containing protein n=1 Tax=Viridothelium virens TaxID=1048519 RepID=A0A6A6H2L2_VIRVR|nr:hypothetical protein EV356DRAFT_578553 [Viridothelium virens]
MTENAGQQPSGPSDRCPSTEPQPSIVHFSGNLPSSSTNFIGSQFHGPVKFEAPTGNQRDYTDPKTECLAAIFKRIGQNPTTVLNSIQSRKGKETPGTCRWILDHERFREWRQHSPSLLCLVRGPGKGKTVLGIYISRILQEIAKDEMTCFFSCEALNKPSTGSTILSCILFQILDQKPNVFKSFEEAFAIQKEQLFEEANFEDLWKAFETIIRNMSLPRINCVLDGVDECTGGTFDLLLQKFKTLFEDCSKFDPGSSTSKSTITPTSVPLGLILIGREDHQICLKRFLSHFENLRIEHDSVCTQSLREDIHFTVKERIKLMANKIGKRMSDFKTSLSASWSVVRKERTYGLP